MIAVCFYTCDFEMNKVHSFSIFFFLSDQLQR